MRYSLTQLTLVKRWSTHTRCSGGRMSATGVVPEGSYDHERNLYIKSYGLYCFVGVLRVFDLNLLPPRPVLFR